MKKMIEWLKHEESGQGMVEYGLIISLVAVALIGALFVLRGNIGNIFSSVQSTLSSPPTTT